MLASIFKLHSGDAQQLLRTGIRGYIPAVARRIISCLMVKAPPPQHSLRCSYDLDGYVFPCRSALQRPLVPLITINGKATPLNGATHS